jgi:hypothetical protein
VVIAPDLDALTNKFVRVQRGPGKDPNANDPEGRVKKDTVTEKAGDLVDDITDKLEQQDRN